MTVCKAAACRLAAAPSIGGAMKDRSSRLRALAPRAIGRSHGRATARSRPEFPPRRHHFFGRRRRRRHRTPDSIRPDPPDHPRRRMAPPGSRLEAARARAEHVHP
ncbi:hypothetical protein G6F65_023253 [Rhizopus arrhizus]|nr:hypothetical protein G6F65_023253 [Rhizopus arrhizus]